MKGIYMYYIHLRYPKENFQIDLIRIFFNILIEVGTDIQPSDLNLNVNANRI